MASQTDIERELYTIFTDHPNSHVNESGEPVIPADALVDVFRAFGDVSNTPLLSDEETNMLKTLLVNNPGLEVTPSILLQFIAEKTRHSPSPGPDDNDTDENSSPRGRNRQPTSASDHHRSSSNESNDASYYGSRPPSRGPPGTPHSRSIFDMERRQRSQPLVNAPSSWNSSKRPAPAARRRSIDGNRSDSEYSISPSAFTRSTSGHMRTRTPSNPASPSLTNADLSFSPVSSPTFSNTYPRPHSRSSSMSTPSYNQQNFSVFGSPGLGDNSLDDETIVNNALLASANSSGEYDYRSDPDSSFGSAINSLPMPSSALDSDSDDEQDSSLGLVLDRNTASSTASMEPLERLDALQRTNAELGRKLMEAERTLRNRLAEHESELEEMQAKLEEMRSELSATKREEKELRSKERQNSTQINALELEVQKITKALEHAKSTYTSLQRQYQEQCSFSEKYRSDLRMREETIRSLRESAQLHELELAKWAREQQGFEERIAHLEAELSVAQGVYAQLDEQKQENLLLKETIDRMRFEMDEMRAGAVLAAGGPGGTSAANTISRSLGAELMGKLKWDEEGAEEEDEEVEDSSFEEGRSTEVERSEDERGSVTAVEFEDEDEEDEDVIQTIITRTKRKVASRAKELPSSKKSHTFAEREHSHHLELEELKEYSDIAIQYDPTLICVSSGVQTLPLPITPTASFSMQTDPEPVPEPTPTYTLAVQTDPEPEPVPLVKVTMEIEIQTDEQPEPVVPSGVDTPPVTQEGEESLASSSSTILPPTPKAHTRALEDEPPTYNQVAAQREEEEKARRVVSDTLSRWHLGATLGLRSLYTECDHKRSGPAVEAEDDRADTLDGIDAQPVEGGVPEELADEWKALKEELGVECLVIDKIIENSAKVPRSPNALATGAPDKGKRRSGRFFNVYNTYVYGDSADTASTSTASATGGKSLATTLTTLATQTLLFASASAVVFLAMAPYLLPSNNVPGGATAYDRAAWASFNTIGGAAPGEGFVFVPHGGVGGGIARAGAGLFGLFGWGAGAGIGGQAQGQAQTTEASFFWCLYCAFFVLPHLRSPSPTFIPFARSVHDLNDFYVSDFFALHSLAAPLYT
ncbi:hypothetical protein P691DRAFT_341899 [Macrolepiota fuliginosa MF-IS2]|uniref:Uncharacterized protein n=1 Tax=Macrolepiota fuliginosa MF-IS2 TaxID=1400762 RepID=A0A9P5X7A4_9AGAR|nr:hypothetical protein P691DRAFT_341899 [Macrolepiota fuliginosa MF-IS2]